MKVSEMVTELRKLGYEVEAYKRTDGSYLIKRINNLSFSAAKGNAYARAILGVELSEARIEQTAYNVRKFIKGSKKPKDAIDEELIKELRKVQRQWRKTKQKGHITKRKLREKISEGGEANARKYLEKMMRYGKGFAYEENVEWLAKYTYDIANVLYHENYFTSSKYEALAYYIRSIAFRFREEWISRVYAYLYEIIDTGYSVQVAEANLLEIYKIIE